MSDNPITGRPGELINRLLDSVIRLDDPVLESLSYNALFWIGDVLGGSTALAWPDRAGDAAPDSLIAKARADGI